MERSESWMVILKPQNYLCVNEYRRENLRENGV
jgi:hypothetical protein